MKKSSLIGHTIELLDFIRPLKQPADNIVKDFFRTRHYLGSKDRRFISDAIYGILRNYRLVRAYAQQAPTSPSMNVEQVPSLLLYISYALKIQNEEVAAVLSDVEGLWQISHPKINCEKALAAIAEAAVQQSSDPIERIALTYSFPDAIVAEWYERFGEVETEKLCMAFNRPAPIVVRVNTLKTSVDECQARLKAEGIESERTELSPFGLKLNKRMNAQALQSYKDGWFEMQDEGSQLLALLLEPKPGDIVVDACAGGGGKTLHFATMMKNEGKLLALDVDDKRLENIRPRLERAGVAIAQLLHAEKEESEIAALKQRSDSVFVDAPCSGVGTYRRNPAAKLSFSVQYVETISKTQRRVLDRYAELVKPGGRLVYSTCTLLLKENENVVTDFLNAHPEFALISASEILGRQNIRVESDSNYLTLLPHKTGTDGFFGAVLQRM